MNRRAPLSINTPPCMYCERTAELKQPLYKIVSAVFPRPTEKSENKEDQLRGPLFFRAAVHLLIAPGSPTAAHWNTFSSVPKTI